MSERQATRYDKLIGKLNGEYYFLDEIFKHSDSFQGATGTVIRPVSYEEYHERTGEENVRDYLKEHWQMAVESDSTEQSLDDWCEMVVNTDGLDETMFSDVVNDERTELLRKQFGLTIDRYPLFEIVGVGRSFSRGPVFDELYDKELMRKIDKVEK